MTGMGFLASNGVGTKSFGKSLWHGRSGAQHINRELDTSRLGSRIAGVLPDVPLPLPSAEACDGDDRVVRLAVAAATEALAAAGQDSDNFEDQRRVGVMIVNPIGGTNFMTEHFPDITDGGQGPIDVEAAQPRRHLHRARRARGRHLRRPRPGEHADDRVHRWERCYRFRPQSNSARGGRRHVAEAAEVPVISFVIAL